MARQRRSATHGAGKMRGAELTLEPRFEWITCRGDLGLSTRNMAVLFVRCVVLIEDEASISKVGACRCILGERGVSKEKTACLILTSHGSGSVQPISLKLVLTVTESAQSCVRQTMHISSIGLITAPFRELRGETRKETGYVVQLLGYPEVLDVWMMDDDGVCLPVSPVSLVYAQQHCRTSLVIEFGL